MKWAASVLCVLLGSAGLAGCAAGGGDQEAPAVVQRFFAAVQHGDQDTACALLTSQTRQELTRSEGQDCAQALPADRLRGGKIRGVDVWSGWARVTVDDSAVFLTEFDAGWRIAAAGCRPEERSPYVCVVGG